MLIFQEQRIFSLSTYRVITYVDVRDGSSTSFWHDHWFSKTLWSNISVQQVFRGRFEMYLRSRLTRAALAEIDSLLVVLQGFRLREGQDVRRMTTTQKPFGSRDAYEALAPSRPLRKTSTVVGYGRRKCQTRLKSSHGYIF